MQVIPLLADFVLYQVKVIHQYYGGTESQRWFVSAPVALPRAPQRANLWDRDPDAFYFYVKLQYALLVVSIYFQ